MAERIALSALAAQLGQEGDRALALSTDGLLTCGEFLEQVQAWRRSFAAAPGQRFALHLDDSVAFAAALYGAWHAGKIVFLPADALPSTIQSISAQVDGFVGAFPGALQATTAPATNLPALKPLDPDACRLILYTSGSSGDPVAIGKSLRQLDSEIEALERRFGERMGSAVVHGTVSHQHIYGLLFRVLWPLSARRVFASSRLGYPEQIVAAIQTAPTVLVSSPALLKRIPDALDWSTLHRALRLVFCSGGPLPAEAAEVVRGLWRQPLVEVFGSTETGGIASREGQAPWCALPGVQWRIEGDLLQVQSVHLPQPGWVETQDRAQPSGDGFVLLGRADRLVKLEERRISLSAIERGLQATPWIDKAQVLMLSGTRFRIAAVAELTETGRELLRSEGRKSLIDRLRDALRGQVDAIGLPKQWRFVEAMPVDSQGKSSERLLAGLFQAERPVPTWLERDSGTARLSLAADADLAVFDGHFEQAPIVPGVALVDWAIRWGREAFVIELPFQRMDAMKFQRVVSPGTELDLSLSWQAETGVLGFRFESAQGVHAGGRIVFATPMVTA
jgi:acyl-CoA synthetase (AMP-forming)/AMP-acid ligase II/3-hydroxymyristoyl/3-hydroxydecanoyl-(acyl carrier protein) dehydratase